MCDDSNSPLIGLLQAAIHSPIERSKLLQQPEILRDIMNNIPARRWLFEQACGSDHPNQATDFIVAMMLSSRLIWRGGKISPHVYSEALSRTWKWFIEHLQDYDPEKASFVTQFNCKLKWMIQDVIQEIADEQKKRFSCKDGEEDNDWIYPPAPPSDRWHETVQEWLELVQNPSHRFIHDRMQCRSYINCQVVLTQILTVLRDSGEFSWDVVAQNYHIKPPALKRFCRTRCFSRFKQVLSEQYFEEF
jgi:hypothetical protein